MTNPEQITNINAQMVGICELKGPVGYPKNPPFNPPEQYPELPFVNEIDPTNNIYPLVREFFYTMGWDSSNFGKKEWNPLGNIIKKGAKVVIKPNWVVDVSQYDMNALITHMSLIRAIIDYAWKASGDEGSIEILESPIQKTDWGNLMNLTGAQKTVEYLKLKGVDVELQDIRTECFVEKDILNVHGWRLKVFYRKKLPGTKKGYVKVDLGGSSALQEISQKHEKFRGIQQWTSRETKKAHNDKNHVYSVPKEVLDCDVFINIPKLKTHRKAGVTLALKNLVGMVNNKDWLPHYVKGTPDQGGDEAPTKIQTYVKLIDKFSIIQFFKKFGFSLRPPNVEKLWRKKIEDDLYQLKNVRQANWYGGDTVWRMVYDLNIILFHANEFGQLKKDQQRNYLAVLDGIIGGERFGPLDSKPKKTGIIIGGTNPVLVDYVGARTMGFDEHKIKSLFNAKRFKQFNFAKYDFADVAIRSNNEKWRLITTHPEKAAFNFVPAPGWEGFIEYQSSSTTKTDSA